MKSSSLWPEKILTDWSTTLFEASYACKLEWV